MILQASRSKLLKEDVFGRTELVGTGSLRRVRRNAGAAAWWARAAARALLRAEARALAVLDDIDGVPALITTDREWLEREYLDGRPMQEGRPTDPAYFREASGLLRRIHRSGVVHNDLAKEPNLLVRPDGKPAIVDFQLARFWPERGKLFRILAREDLRHLLKHKRTYCAECLTSRERNILARPSPIARVWMATVKPVYLFVTRRLMGWEDREGAGDRV
jgi:RIO-like serine/threonine protein kinase